MMSSMGPDGHTPRRSHRCGAWAGRRGHRHRTGFEPLEARAVPSTLVLPAAADGRVVDRDRNGTFETVVGGTPITNRRFDAEYDPARAYGPERGIFEFDLRGIAPGTVIRSAAIGLEVLVHTHDARVVVRAYQGDGAVGASDGHAAATTASQTYAVTSLSYVHFNLDTATIASLVGGFAGLRLENAEVNGGWVGVSSRVDPLFEPPTLMLELADSTEPPPPPDPEPTLDLRLTLANGNLQAGQATTARLTRSDDELSQERTVRLQSSDPAVATVPESVTFAAGEATADFLVTAVGVGAREVTVTATVSTDMVPAGLDASFGQGGLVFTSPSISPISSARAVTLQADGKILAAREAPGGWRLMRFHHNGQADASFGDFGAVVTSLTAGSLPVPHVIVLQGDGKILVGGKYSGGTGSGMLARYNPDGSLDPTFGIGGILNPLPLLSDAWVEDLVVRPDGTILVGNARNGPVYSQILVLDDNGSYRSLIELPVGDRAGSLEPLPGGKLLVAGSRTISRVNPDGSLDASFGQGGTQTIRFDPATSNSVLGMALDHLGRVVVWGATFVNNTAGSSDLAVARLTPDGAVDTSFSRTGAVRTDIHGLDDRPNAMVVQHDGKVVLAGFAYVTSTTWNVVLVRYDVDGSLDATFDGDGIYVGAIIGSDDESIDAATLRPDGKLVALAGRWSDIRLARFQMAQAVERVRAEATLVVVEPNRRPVVLAGQSFTVAPFAANGWAVGTVAAVDPDASQGLTWEIVADDTSGAFAIDPITGAISVADGRKLDGSAPTYTLTVRVTDTGSPVLRAEAPVIVSLSPAILAVDLKPGDPANRIALGINTVVRVAILSTPTFDARLVDVTSLRFGRKGSENSLKRTRKGLVPSSRADVNGDGLLDLVASFNIARTGLRARDTVASMTGRLNNGVGFTRPGIPVLVRRGKALRPTLAVALSRLRGAAHTCAEIGVRTMSGR